MASQYYVARPGQTQREGPFTREQLEEGLQAGRFGATDLVWETGTNEWIPLSTLAMPPMPEMPPLPDMPPLPAMPPPPAVDDVPPPPPLDDMPPPPYYSGAVRKPSSPAGLLALVVGIAGCAGAAYMFYDLNYQSPPLRAHRFSENTVAIVAAASGFLTFLVASAGCSRKFRNRDLASFSLLLGFVLLLAGVAAFVFHTQFASLRYVREERAAQNDITTMGLLCIKYADKHGGRFPDSLEELRTVENADMLYRAAYEQSGVTRQIHVTPGLRQTSPGETVLLRDSWESGRNTHAVYLVSGAAKIVEGEGQTEAASGKAETAGQAKGLLDLPKKMTAGARGGDYTSPEKTIEAIVAAGHAGNIEGVRRAMTPEGFQKEFGAATARDLLEEFKTTRVRIKSKGFATPAGNGTSQMRVVLSFTDEGQTEDQEAVFELRGGEWLLHSL